MKSISQKGLDLIKSFEGCHLTSYLCPAGIWTIGYGTTTGAVPGVIIGPNMTITQAQADEWFKYSIDKRYGANVNKYDKIYNWTQNEFDALTSFAYNIGSIDKLVEKGNKPKDKIANSMLAYNKSKGQVLAGLTRRRNAERALFMTPDVTVSSGAKVADATNTNPKKELKDVSEIAKEVIDGKWGSGGIRRKKLTDAGYNYEVIQRYVNSYLNNIKPEKKSNIEIAKEVISGKWGRGGERKRRLTQAGYNWMEVQKEVNKLLK
jgi:GH24 family phage-related lysozyme (muramidase)